MVVGVGTLKAVVEEEVLLNPRRSVGTTLRCRLCLVAVAVAVVVVVVARSLSCDGGRCAVGVPGTGDTQPYIEEFSTLT